MNKILQHKKIIALVLILIVGGFIATKVFNKKSQTPTFQTAQVTKGQLITSITASGQISSGNNVDITTQASGVVSNVYVKNGDKVTQGQNIAEITLDQASQQKQQSAWASYLSAKASLDNANNQLNTLQNTEFTTNQKFINDAVARGLTTDDPTYIEENAAWMAAENDYKNQQTSIAQANASLSSSWLAYQQVSPIVTAPISGTVTNLTLSTGTPIASTTSSSSSSTTTSTQKLGSVAISGPIQASVNLAEVDVTKASVGQKATLTLDAFPDKTFTGKIVSIDTTGAVSSGVTTYPAIIALDNNDAHIYPNMGVNATIITQVKDDVLLVPSGAIQTQSGAKSARILKNNQPSSVSIETGLSNDTDTEVTSGLNEGDTVVTGSTAATTTTTSTGTSPFSALGGNRTFGGGGGAAVRGGGAPRGGGG